MAFVTLVSLLVVLSSVSAAPSTINGKPPIDWTCTMSPVRSADPVRCFNEQVTPSGNTKEPILFEGDIAGVIEDGDTIADLDMKLNGVSRAGTLQYPLWWGGFVYYEIASSFTAAERAIIQRAFKEFERTEAVRFYQRTGSEPNYLTIFKGSGCWSWVGQHGGAQQLSLGQGCVHYGTIVHELNHAVGFWHEQSRPDRDSYIDLNLNNVPQDQHHAFNKYGASIVTTSGTGYDFGSIMHYNMYAFAINPSIWTIRPKTQYQNYQIGQIEKLSDTDIQEINALYPLCATLWYDADYSGPHSLFVSGIQTNLHANAQDQYSSAKVTLGCTLTTYNRVNFQGTATTFKPTQEGVLWYSFEGQSYDNDVRSLKCTCA
ncbi:zinc metalloproteinase nas-4-like [Paramacrobiotus metropolitanus]|uniref:zinc metalloproteinase nas-4-like n=1 Tax=Paramacrobiotus metropolitanus TaxID=2943436 RepID=UPI0024460305|nr:zinc metalloproteinase nas-4-like [Paramacrobiotus metropolitanus]